MARQLKSLSKSDANRMVITFVVGLGLLTGCTGLLTPDKPTPKVCPKFPVEQFKAVDTYDVKNIKTVDVNGTKYIMQPVTDYVDFVNQYKVLKKDYSILRDNIIQFEKDKDELNR